MKVRIRKNLHAEMYFDFILYITVGTTFWPSRFLSVDGPAARLPGRGTKNFRTPFNHLKRERGPAEDGALGALAGNERGDHGGEERAEEDHAAEDVEEQRPEGAAERDHASFQVMWASRS